MDLNINPHKIPVEPSPTKDREEAHSSVMNLLSSFWRKLGVGITRVIRISLIPAKERLLDNTPLKLKVNKEAVVDASRLKANTVFKLGDPVGHLKILQELEELAKLQD